MKKGILEAILHGLHIIYEALKNIGIALAKSLGITGKSKLLVARKIVLISFVIISASALIFSETEIISIHDGPYINPQLPAGFYTNSSDKEPSSSNKSIENKIQVTNSKLCLNCSGKGEVEESYYVNEWIQCTACGGDGLVDNNEFPCGVCMGKGGHYENRKYIIDVICSVCNGKGYIPV